MSIGKQVFTMAIEALVKAQELVNTDGFKMACDLISSRRVWTCGMGKAGLAGHKLASTLASNGTPAAYLHAAECLHGDFGAIQHGDVVVAFSNSGRTSEVMQVANKLSDIGAALILITGDGNNDISAKADVVLCYGKIIEACPLGLTPTTSVTVMMVLADAIAMAVQNIRGLTYNQYSVNHHAGYLGQISKERSRNPS